MSLLTVEVRFLEFFHFPRLEVPRLSLYTRE